jgi:hypothetical protein
MKTKKTAKKTPRKTAQKVEKQELITNCDLKEEVPDALVKASPQEALVISLANNPRYVYASLNGTKIAVEVPAWMSPRLIRKTITVIKKLDSEHYEIFKDGN